MIWLYILGVLLTAFTVLADVWTDIDYHLAANVSLIYISALVTVFTIRYGFWSNWKANRVGKVVLTKSITFSVVLWLITLQNWWDVDWPGRQQVRFVVYTLGAIAYLGMVVILVQQQTADQHARDGIDMPE